MTRTSEKRTAARHETGRRLAPHVEDDWTEAFVLELRLLDVPGPALGAALAEVESHCAESGESAAEAFGDPVTYARDLDLPADPGRRWDLLTAVGPVGTQVLGMLVLGWGGGEAVHAARDGNGSATVGLTVGMVCLVAALTVTAVLLARHASRLLRLVVERPVVSWFLFTLLTGSLGVLAVLLDTVIVEVAAVPTALAGALVLAAGTVWSVAQARRGTLDDPVVPPVAAPDERAEAAPGAGARLASAVLTWIIPLLALVPLGAAWLTAGP